MLCFAHECPARENKGAFRSASDIRVWSFANSGFEFRESASSEDDDPLSIKVTPSVNPEPSLLPPFPTCALSKAGEMLNTRPSCFFLKSSHRDSLRDPMNVPRVCADLLSTILPSPPPRRRGGRGRRAGGNRKANLPDGSGRSRESSYESFPPSFFVFTRRGGL